jgi:hypothetical protein
VNGRLALAAPARAPGDQFIGACWLAATERDQVLIADGRYERELPRVG